MPRPSQRAAGRARHIRSHELRPQTRQLRRARRKRRQTRRSARPIATRRVQAPCRARRRDEHSAYNRELGHRRSDASARPMNMARARARAHGGGGIDVIGERAVHTQQTCDGVVGGVVVGGRSGRAKHAHARHSLRPTRQWAQRIINQLQSSQARRRTRNRDILRCQ
jgi:hypothetical protein